jgi:hypothetical protein
MTQTSKKPTARTASMNFFSTSFLSTLLVSFHSGSSDESERTTRVSPHRLDSPLPAAAFAVSLSKSYCSHRM